MMFCSRCWPTMEAATGNRIAWWIDEQIVNRHVFASVLRWSARYRTHIPRMNRLVAAASLSTTAATRTEHCDFAGADAAGA